MATKQDKIDALEARVAELDHENQALAAQLEARKASPAPAVGGACCKRVVAMIVRAEGLGGRKHANYLKMAAALKPE